MSDIGGLYKESQKLLEEYITSHSKAFIEGDKVSVATRFLEFMKKIK